MPPPCTATETEKLIKLVKENRYMYDLSDPDYKNRRKRLETWATIADEMGRGNALIWSAKWKGLRDNYAKYKRTRDPSLGKINNYKKYKNWPWASRMKFLDHCVSFNERRPVNFMLNNENQSSISSEPDNMIHIPEVNQSILPPSVEYDSMPGSSGSASEIKKPEHMNETSDYLRMKRNEDSLYDEADHFFLSYAQTFKNLPKKMQIMLKLDIATLFNRYELQAAEEDTIKQAEEEVVSDSGNSIVKIEYSEYSDTNTFVDDYTSS